MKEENVEKNLLFFFPSRYFEVSKQLLAHINLEMLKKKNSLVTNYRKMVKAIVRTMGKTRDCVFAKDITSCLRRDSL